jgi:hypothetical protein
MPPPGFLFLNNGILPEFLTLEDGTDRLFQNVGKKSPPLAA